MTIRMLGAVSLGFVLIAAVVLSAQLTTSERSQSQRPHAPEVQENVARHVSEPTISWSASEEQLTLFPGQALTKTVEFVSNSQLSLISVDVVPQLEPFLTVWPRAISLVKANQTQKLTLVFSIPIAASLGTYDGTVHIRTGRRTHANPLKLAVVVSAQSFTGTTIPVSLLYPTQWNSQVNSDSVIFTNSPEFSNIEDTDLSTMAFLQITRRGPSPGRRGDEPANPAVLPIDQWFTQYFSRGFPTLPISQDVVVVAGRPAVKIVTSELGGTRVHVYVPTGMDVFELSYGLSAADVVPIYEAMVDSLTIE